ncbi:hypothetical protein [Noviherbaspirillum denitrificans]|uniref:Uncharacterized protein n=1 Tax=Noviherbaspirillum denitrificans TaxID=1968433 RepID=A0A254TIT3_9BURK|nr:hypothetical protein [Noviherbaspirillum denitrificans]OWW22550.1 hypothetical protein AYR66_26645 [Noviherbaspirillum denitrificans]
MNLNQIKADLLILARQQDEPLHVREIAKESLEAIEYLERELDKAQENKVASRPLGASERR